MALKARGAATQKRKAIATKRQTKAPGPKPAPASRTSPGSVSSPTAPSATGGTVWTPAAGEVGIRVRMYRVGFGDFFLITLLTNGSKPVHVIVDCGVFKGTSQKGDIGSIEAAVADMARTTGGQVALVIMTHRHADHIAGFARCADTFKTLTVGGVWMPIWESEYEPKALKFQAELTRTAVGLRQHFAKASVRGSGQTALQYVENATGELDVAGAAATGSNAAALDLLKHGFSGVTPHYYTRGDKAQLPQALADAGLSCQILGPPPVTDIDLMKLMDLQKNVGQYLAQDGGDVSRRFAPFNSEWEIKPPGVSTNGSSTMYSSESFREWARGERKSWESVTSEEARQARLTMERLLQQSQPIAALTAAKQLNSFLNNQSLVVLFTFKGKKLLFVGDAQAGNWEHWLFDTDTPDKQASGTMGTVARQILTSLDFYKVGHHGSGNATPKSAAELMGAQGHKFAALCSTEAGVYGTEDPDDSTKGTEVPRGPLLAKLATESALVRSDQIAITIDGKQIPATAPAALPTTPPGCRLAVGPIWIDCYL